jgi:hypothetical protein
MGDLGNGYRLFAEDSADGSESTLFVDRPQTEESAKQNRRGS